MSNTATGHTSNKNTNNCGKLKSERERERELKIRDIVRDRER